MHGNYKMYLMMAGHICADMSQGALPAILPFLIAADNISYAAAGGLIFAANIVSSLIQPFFGYLGDKISMPWLMSLGILLSGGGIAAIGFIDSYAGILLASGISGVGVALFHPEGGRVANLMAGTQKGRGMSIFAVGGNIGFAVGPILTATAISVFGLPGTAVILLPCIVIALILLIEVRKLDTYAPKSMRKKADGAQDTTSAATADKVKMEVPACSDDWPAFIKTAVVVFCRSIIYYALLTLIPLYWVGILNLSEAAGSLQLSIFSVAAIAATIVGGRLADRYGFKRIIVTGCLLAAPLIALFAFMKAAPAATIVIILISVMLSGSYSSMIATAQSFLPRRLGLASGITMGLSVSIGGMTTPGMGLIADTLGLPAALLVTSGIAVLALIFSLMIPVQQKSAYPD